jgi:hypothetical protein
MSLAPLPDALDLGRAAEIIPVMGLLMPPALAGSLAGLATCGLGTVALVPDVARVRRKEGPTVLALPFAGWTSHEPVSPQAHELQSAAETEENGEHKSGPKHLEEDGRRGEICYVRKKMAQPTRPVDLDGLSTVSGYR